MKHYRAIFRIIGIKTHWDFEAESQADAEMKFARSHAGCFVHSIKEKNVKN